tara:strand:- start:2568 stop:3545 length:978 start_codon:yes stop_codon:yes gene_type:complete
MILRFKYWKRIIKSYFLSKNSNLSFWHGQPQINEFASYTSLDQYYMKFHYKANYVGVHDKDGIPLLDYQGDIGIQYNPIAIAQWSLGNYNLWKRKKLSSAYQKFILGSEWLNDNLVPNKNKIHVWNHYFNWVYKETLVNPWYSGLAQGQGLSVLCRAYKETKDPKYLKSLEKVFESLKINVKDGGVMFKDSKNNIWIEEYIMQNTPTHILNGFIWGLWGIYDYWLLTNDKKVNELFLEYINTLENNINSYDIGYWSLYELSDNIISMRASLFYHKLHIVQMNILFEMTRKKIFKKIGLKWSSYLDNKLNIIRATLMKIIFKIFYY